MTLVAAACGGSSHVTTAKSSGGTSSTEASSSTAASPTTKHADQNKKTGTAPGTTASTLTTIAGRRMLVVPVTGTLGTVAHPSGSNPVVDSQGPAPTNATTTPTTRHNTTTTVKPYDPSQSIDLSGFPGESLAQTIAAEQLVRATLQDLPRYSTEDAARAAGYRTIGDAFTGDEHLVNWAYLTDNHVLDPMFPESLVYDTRCDGPSSNPCPGPRLEAAMFMLSLGQRFSDIPPLYAGPLTQWHVHSNLCFLDLGGSPDQKVVAGLTDGNGNCPAGEEKSVPVPMIHVWIVKNPCGPFAALNGIGAGQTQDGTHLCDTGHAGVL